MKKQKRYITDFLFSTPSFLGGAGTVMNLAGSFYEFNTYESGSEADMAAIENDFRLVGQDIYNAFEDIKLDKIDLISLR